MTAADEPEAVEAFAEKIQATLDQDHRRWDALMAALKNPPAGETAQAAFARAWAAYTSAGPAG